jgi:hypothetical protein
VGGDFPIPFSAAHSALFEARERDREAWTAWSACRRFSAACVHQERAGWAFFASPLPQFPWEWARVRVEGAAVELGARRVVVLALRTLHAQLSSRSSPLREVPVHVDRVDRRY